MKKAEALESATHESAEHLKNLQADYKTKVGSIFFSVQRRKLILFVDSQP